MSLTAHKILSASAYLAVALLFVSGHRLNAAEVHAPTTVIAGQGFSITVEGSGEATFYLLGPDHVLKRNVNLGGDLKVESSDVRTAGRYQVLVCAHSCSSTTFEVQASQPEHLSFFLHPSRVPVSSRDAIDGFAFVFDQYFNLILTRSTLDFQIKRSTGSSSSERVPTKSGVSWIHTDSSPHEGPVEVIASIGGIAEARVVQQVAADACRLDMKAVKTGNIVAVETDPIRDCQGNPLPDGTIVSFTKTDSAGRSTVDVPIKKGVARTQFNLDGPMRIGIACGVVLGKEITVNGRA
jgi:hypothetical protein